MKELSLEQKYRLNEPHVELTQEDDPIHIPTNTRFNGKTIKWKSKAKKTSKRPPRSYKYRSPHQGSHRSRAKYYDKYRQGYDDSGLDDPQEYDDRNHVLGTE